MSLKAFYRFSAPPDPECVSVVFGGLLQGEAVIWEATLYTRAGYARVHPDAPLTGNLIEVGGEGTDGRLLTVVIDVPAIDRPTILKTLHMIRQWKRLAPGRHVFGGAR